MNKNSEITRSYTKNPFWYQQIDLQQIGILGDGQLIVDFDAADSCCLYVTTLKAINFQDDIPSIHFDELDYYCVLAFGSTSMQRIVTFTTSRSTTEAGAKLYLSSRSRY